MTKIQQTFFVGVLALLAAGQISAKTVQPPKGKGHAKAETVKAKPHPKQHRAATKTKHKHEQERKHSKRKRVAEEPQHFQKSSGDFSQTGKASWYGKNFHGKRTSNGEKFDMNALTAAHRTLPLSSYARVTNLANGKSVVVRINDRGPFHSNRVMDMSRGAAAKLGFVGRGSANVRIEPVAAHMLSHETTVAQNGAATSKL